MMQRRPRRRANRGIVLLLLVVGLAAIFGALGLVFDVGMMYSDRQRLRHASDAAATAAAMELRLGKSSVVAGGTADNLIVGRNGFADADTTVHIPPISGAYAGRAGFVEVVAERSYATKIMQAVGAPPVTSMRSRSVAGAESATAGAAIVVLDSRPPPVSVGIALPLALNYPALIAGLEVLGLGAVRVDGSVLVNTVWGGVDENGESAGESAGPPYGVACTPLLPLTRLQARDIRVVGGVDDEANYSDFVSGQPSPLTANRLPVPDPLASLPVPSSGTPGVDTTLRGGVRVVGLPLIGTTTLQPGVYEYIDVVSGNVVFSPGVYIIRSTSPITDAALTILGTTVVADGVCFYITNSTSFDPVSGLPDANDAATTATPPATSQLTPSVIINAAILNSRFRGLSGGPLDGVLLFQRRNDYRPIVIVNQTILGGAAISGRIYAKRGHLIFAADGTYDLGIVAGSIRLIPVLSQTFAPSQRLPPATDVYLVE
jgi:Flp pilus assembly protein TadG